MKIIFSLSVLLVMASALWLLANFAKIFNMIDIVDSFKAKNKIKNTARQLNKNLIKE